MFSLLGKKSTFMRHFNNLTMWAACYEQKINHDWTNSMKNTSRAVPLK